MNINERKAYIIYIYQDQVAFDGRLLNKITNKKGSLIWIVK